MIKAEILAIANNVELMNNLNSISGLLEINKKEDHVLINQMVDEFYHKINSLEHETKKTTRARMLHYIMDMDPELYLRLKSKRWAEIKYEYNKLTNNSQS